MEARTEYTNLLSWPRLLLQSIGNQPFDAHAGHFSGRHYFGHNSPTAAARDMFKSSTDATSLLSSIKKHF